MCDSMQSRYFECLMDSGREKIHLLRIAYLFLIRSITLGVSFPPIMGVHILPLIIAEASA